MRRIRPIVEEISLAFNPANKRKFILHKDNSNDEGGNEMKGAIAFLEKSQAVESEAAFLTYLKDQKVNEELTERLQAAFRLISKDEMPIVVTHLYKTMPAKTFEVIEKEIETVLRKDIEKDVTEKVTKEVTDKLEKDHKMEKDETVTLLSNTVETLKKDLDTTKESLVKEKDARRTVEIRKEITDLNIPGDINKMTDMILKAEKVNPELAKDVQTMLHGFGDLFKDSGLFKELGNKKVADGDSAYDQLVKIAKDKQGKNPDLTFAKALAEAGQENIGLFKEYNKDQLRRSRGIAEEE